MDNSVNSASETMIDKVKSKWAEQSQTSKKTIIFSSIVLVILIGIVGYLYNRDNYEFLVSNDDTTVSANVINYLKTNEIEYTVKNNAIYVANVNTDSLKLELSGEGYFSSSNSTIDLFKETLFISDAQEQKLIQKDLENNIASAIKSYNEVKNANVILTIGNQSSFANDNVASTAAIQVQLKSTLSTKQVKSIQEFVAASVPNLSSEDVVITDTDNNLLSTNSDTVSLEDNTAYVNVLENKMNTQISDLLSGAFPNTSFKVVSRIDVNFDETKIESNVVSSSPDTIVSQEIYSEITTNSSTNGITGSESNVPSYETNGSSDEGISEIKKETTNYELNTEKTQTTKQPEVTKINVAVIANSQLSDADIAKVQDLVETASGCNENRGDKVTVQAFASSIEEVEEKETVLNFIKNNFDSLANKFLILVILILILIVILKLLSVFKKSKDSEPIEIEDVTGVTENIPSMNQPTYNDSAVDFDINVQRPINKKKEALEKEFERNPEQIASALSSWMEKDQK